MNNSIFGKTIENLCKRVDVRLVINEKKLDKLTAKPTYVSSKIFNENLMAVHKVKETLTLNRPAYVGMCILDLSKMLMYDFHYNYIKKKYNNRARLSFTDTDSLTYEIEAEDVYKDFWNNKDVDTIKYNHKHQSFYQTYQPPYFWTRYRSFLLSKISSSILLDKISILFTFAKYRPPYFWTRFNFLKRGTRQK